MREADVSQHEHRHDDHCLEGIVEGDCTPLVVGADLEGDVHVKDGIHLTESGVAAYSDTINQALLQLTTAQQAAAPPAGEPVPAPEP